MKEVLKVTGLKKQFNGEVVVNDLSFNVYEGDVFGFLGPNGAGKSTTIRMILNLIKKDSGNVEINGYNIDDNFKSAMGDVSAIVEAPKFYLNLSAYDNLKLIKNLGDNIPKERIYEVLQIVGLKDREKDKVREYSLGMKQRLGIAMALIKNPKLIILDEPTNGLDPKGIIEVRELIKNLAYVHKKTVLISSHLLNEIQLMCNRVVIINKGKTMAQGNINEIINNKILKVEITTSNKDQIRNLIETLNYCKFKTFTGNGVIITLEKNFETQLLRDLVNNNMDVTFITNRSESLEDAFINIVGGTNND